MKLKTSLKIVLLVSFMLITMCAFNVVYAETMTVDEVLELVPETISADVKQADYKDAEDEIIASVEESLAEKGVDTADYEISYSLYTTYLSVSIKNEDGKYTYKSVTVEYSDYNAEDDQIIQDYFAQFDLSGATGIFCLPCYSYDELKDNSVEAFINGINTYYPLPDGVEMINVSIAGEGPGTYSTTEVIGFNLYKDGYNYGYFAMYFYRFIAFDIPDDVEDTEEAKIEYGRTALYDFIKENFTYYEKLASSADNITITYVSGDIYKFELEDNEMGWAYNYHIFLFTEDSTTSDDRVTVPEDSGIVISAEEIENTESTYEELEEKLEEDGYSDIVVAFEVTLISGDISNGVEISFNVGTDYNGKQAIILHKKSDGTYETATDTVEDGIVKMTVNELSPFMIAFVETTTDTNTTTTDELDETPKTGASEIAVQICMAIAITSVIGLAVTKRK